MKLPVQAVRQRPAKVQKLRIADVNTPITGHTQSDGFEKLLQASPTTFPLLPNGRRVDGMGMQQRIETLQGDVANLPFDDGTFDVVLCMNGFHVFGDKEGAYGEVCRVLKPGGKLIATLYVRGESRLTDVIASGILARKGWFSKPFDTNASLKERLNAHYHIDRYDLEGSMAYFLATKK